MAPKMPTLSIEDQLGRPLSAEERQRIADAREKAAAAKRESILAGPEPSKRDLRRGDASPRQAPKPTRRGAGGLGESRDTLDVPGFGKEEKRDIRTAQASATRAAAQDIIEAERIRRDPANIEARLKAEEQARKEEIVARKTRGRAGTILTGPSGAGPTGTQLGAGSIGRKTLLGA